jgi:hypothetical protein
MSDIKTRTVAEIQKEYTELCARAGHLAYSIFALKSDLSLVHERQKDVNIEGAMAQKSEAESAKSAAPALSVVPAPESSETPAEGDKS